jgi:transposase-like protein
MGWETFTIPDETLMKVYGVETMAEVKAIQAEEAKLMCDCEDIPDSYYVNDNQSEVCDKHHWCCTGCNKITQIG